MSLPALSSYQVVVVQKRDGFWMPDCCWQLGLGPLELVRLQRDIRLHRLSSRRSTLLEVSASVGGPGEGLHREFRCLVYRVVPSSTGLIVDIMM